MYLSNEILVFALLIIPVIFLYVVNRISHSKSNEKILSYKDKIIVLNETIKQIQESKNAMIKVSSYRQDELKEQEELKEVIQKQKKQIIDLTAMAKEAINTKYDFLSNMRHEIRTPLNSILTFSSLLKDELLDDEFQEYANNISLSGNNLLVYVNKMLELGEIESGHFKRKDTVINLNEFINNLIIKPKIKANKKGLLFDIKIDRNIPNLLILDKDKIENILANFLDNALKFTKYGSIKVELKLKSIDKVKNSVNISFMVKDSGKGINEEHKKTIFDIFEKKDGGGVEQYQSASLGLSINKKIANQLDGDIVLVSEVDKGSIFSLYLNDVEIGSVEQDNNINEDNINFSLLKPAGGVIAIVDAQIRNIKMLRDSFEGTSIKVLEFIETREALETLKDEEIDLLYIDAEILTMDDGTVSRVMKNIVDAPVISLIQGHNENIKFNSKGIIPISHIKKPISKIDLFKSSMMVLNSQNVTIQNNNVYIEGQSISNKEIDFKKLGKFLTMKEIKLNSLYKVASQSNDLNSIKVFASTLLELSDIYEINTLHNYAKLLLKKVDLLDMETVSFLMKEYDKKIQELENIR